MPVSALTNASSLSHSPSTDPGTPTPSNKKRARSQPSTDVQKKRKSLPTATTFRLSQPNMSYASDITVAPSPEDFSIPATQSSSPSTTSPSTTHRKTTSTAAPTVVKSEPAITNCETAPPSTTTTLPKTPSSRTRPNQVSKPSSTPQTTTSTPSGATSPKSHTRKCREKVTRQFEHLLNVLPPPPRGVEVKHKAQILDYTIKIFRYLLLQRTTLQAQIALASKSALTQCINNVIANATANLSPQARMHPLPILTLLEPFVGLYCVKRNWTYAEVWLTHNTTNQTSLVSCLFNSDDNAVLTRLDAFATESRKAYRQASTLPSGIVHRAMATQRSEWLSTPANDANVFRRADLARAHGLCVVNAVPVLTPMHNYSAVLLFADVVPHTFSVTDVNTLQDYANTLSNIYIDYVKTFDSSVAPKLSIPHAPNMKAEVTTTPPNAQCQRRTHSSSLPANTNPVLPDSITPSPPMPMPKREPVEVSPMDSSSALLSLTDSNSRWLPH